MSHDELHGRGPHERQRHLVEVAGDALIAQEEAWVGHAGQDGQSRNRLAVSATNHCLTGCLTGEVTGMVIATVFGWGDVASIAAAVGLGFLFGKGHAVVHEHHR